MIQERSSQNLPGIVYEEVAHHMHHIANERNLPTVREDGA